jgi:c-di-GMP-related signal transduction protein
LSPDLVAALVDGAGPLGQILTAVQDYENGDPAALAALLTPDEAVRTYLDALRWSTDVLRSVSPRQDSAAASTVS